MYFKFDNIKIFFRSSCISTCCIKHGVQKKEIDEKSFKKSKT